MKLVPTLRPRPFILAGMFSLAISLGMTDQLFSGAALQAQTTANAPAETDKETGKPIVTTASGLKYVELAPGDGVAAKSGDHIFVHYEGRLVDGTKFDSSYDRGQPIDFVLGMRQVIQGWDEGLTGMKAGGKRKLIIPPSLAYGQQGAGDVIPPNATLIFKVELVSINPK